jgi:predicted nucleic acid-binding protein
VNVTKFKSDWMCTLYMYIKCSFLFELAQKKKVREFSQIFIFVYLYLNKISQCIATIYVYTLYVHQY